MMEFHYLLGPQEIFTVFFIMLGPVKMLAPFAAQTKDQTLQEIRRLALKSAFYATLAASFGGLIGSQLLNSWHVSNAVLMLTGAVIFLLTALQMIFGQNQNAPASSQSGALTSLDVVFKMIVTPYGMAAVISLLSMSESLERALLIFSVLFFVMILNFLAMTFIRQLMGKIGQITLRFVGAILGVLQASLAAAMINTSLRMLIST